MSEWISVEDRLPDHEWMGLVVTNVRARFPVIAHRGSANYEFNFPYAGHFIGRWKEAILIGDHMRDSATVTHWLECDELYPEPPK